MVTIEESGPVAILTVADMAALSHHGPEAGRQLRDAVVACGDRDDLKVIVLCAGGADFCAPSSPKPSRTLADAAWWHEIYASATGVYQSLCYSKKVTIAAIHGQCADAGSLLVLCADLAVARSDATFHSPFHTMPEANFVLAALTMRLNRAKGWMLSGVPLDAKVALAAGLLNRTVETDVMGEAMAMARSVAKMPLDGIAISKLVVESCIDAQGVGQDFDMAGLVAATEGLGGVLARESGA